MGWRKVKIAGADSSQGALFVRSGRRDLSQAPPHATDFAALGFLDALARTSDHVLPTAAEQEYILERAERLNRTFPGPWGNSTAGSEQRAAANITEPVIGPINHGNFGLAPRLVDAQLSKSRGWVAEGEQHPVRLTLVVPLAHELPKRLLGSLGALDAVSGAPRNFFTWLAGLGMRRGAAEAATSDMPAPPPHCRMRYFLLTHAGSTWCLAVDARSPHRPCLHLFDPRGATLGGSTPGGAYIITWMELRQSSLPFNTKPAVEQAAHFFCRRFFRTMQIEGPVAAAAAMHEGTDASPQQRAAALRDAVTHNAIVRVQELVSAPPAVSDPATDAMLLSTLRRPGSPPVSVNDMYNKIVDGQRAASPNLAGGGANSTRPQGATPPPPSARGFINHTRTPGGLRPAPASADSTGGAGPGRSLTTANVAIATDTSARQQPRRGSASVCGDATYRAAVSQPRRGAAAKQPWARAVNPRSAPGAVFLGTPPAAAPRPLEARTPSHIAHLAATFASATSAKVPRTLSPQPTSASAGKGLMRSQEQQSSLRAACQEPPNRRCRSRPGSVCSEPPARTAVRRTGRATSDVPGIGETEGNVTTQHAIAVSMAALWTSPSARRAVQKVAPLDTAPAQQVVVDQKSRVATRRMGKSPRQTVVADPQDIGVQDLSRLQKAFEASLKKGAGARKVECAEGESGSPTGIDDESLSFHSVLSSQHGTSSVNGAGGEIEVINEGDLSTFEAPPVVVTSSPTQSTPAIPPTEPPQLSTGVHDDRAVPKTAEEAEPEEAETVAAEPVAVATAAATVAVMAAAAAADTSDHVPDDLSRAVAHLLAATGGGRGRDVCGAGSPTASSGGGSIGGKSRGSLDSAFRHRGHQRLAAKPPKAVIRALKSCAEKTVGKAAVNGAAAVSDGRGSSGESPLGKPGAAETRGKGSTWAALLGCHCGSGVQANM